MKALSEVYLSKGKDDSEFVDLWQKFVQINGFHSDIEMELMEPRWYEIPEKIIERIEKTSFIHSKAQNQFHIDQHGFVIKNPIRKFVFKRVVKFVRSYLARKEKMRIIVTQCYAIIRSYLLSIEKDYVNQGDLEKDGIFMLKIDELMTILSGEKDIRSYSEGLKIRNSFFHAMKNFKAPNEFGMETVEVESVSEFDEKGQLCLLGVGASAGVVAGRACVLRSVDEAHRLKEGEVLVTQFTDPSWTAVMGIASGVVTEVGGVLSHAAIISRELSIPAVLNVKGVFENIEMGDYIIVDGNKGTVIKQEKL